MPLAARVILTTYENLPALRLALRGYLRQTTREFGITVADDGSGPETRAFVADFRDEARDHGIEHVTLEPVPASTFSSKTVADHLPSGNIDSRN